MRHTTPLVQIFATPERFYNRDISIYGYLRKDSKGTMRLLCSRNDRDVGFGEAVFLDFDDRSPNVSEVYAEWPKWDQVVFVEGILHAASTGETPRLAVRRICPSRKWPASPISRMEFASDAHFQGEKQDTPWLVSVERLLFNPMVFHDRTIRVQGYMIVEPEYCSLWSSPDCERGCCIDLSSSISSINFRKEEIRAAYSRQFVTLEGRFHVQNADIYYLSISAVTVHEPVAEPSNSEETPDSYTSPANVQKVIE